jgi:hypothetical protein
MKLLKWLVPAEEPAWPAKVRESYVRIGRASDLRAPRLRLPCGAPRARDAFDRMVTCLRGLR